MKTAIPLALLVAATAACSGASAPPPSRPAKTEPVMVLTAAEKVQILESREQRRAQRAWCDYLDALWVRTAQQATLDPALDVPRAAMLREVPRHWPLFDQCLEVTTPASPKMLRQTADCSLAALKRFQGDPFTPDHAAEVSRCGAEAIEGMQVSPAELQPFVATICSRMTSCGDVSMLDCIARLRAHLGPHLERAIGALNRRGRTELNACLKGVACEDVGSHIAGCLQPLMDDLLWLPD